MNFNLEYELNEFRKIEKDSFWEDGKAQEAYPFSKNIAEQMLKIINMLELENKELKHFKECSTGLFVIDKKIDDIFVNIPDGSGCKTVVEAYLVQQINYLKTLIYKI